jgi:hypothetical protein
MTITAAQPSCVKTSYIFQKTKGQKSDLHTPFSESVYFPIVMKSDFFSWIQDNQEKNRQIVPEFRNFRTFQWNLTSDYSWIQEFQNFSVKPDCKKAIPIGFLKRVHNGVILLSWIMRELWVPLLWDAKLTPGWLFVPFWSCWGPMDGPTKLKTGPKNCQFLKCHLHSREEAKTSQNVC